MLKQACLGTARTAARSSMLAGGPVVTGAVSAVIRRLFTKPPKRAELEVIWRCPGSRWMSNQGQTGQEKELPPLVYEDTFIKGVLSEVRTIAMVGASANWNRPSYFAMKYLQAKGFRVIPINPGSAGKPILGEHTYTDLAEMNAAGLKVDMVDVFQRPDKVGPIADDAVKIGAKVLWMQLGVRNEEAAARAAAAGLKVVQDRCPKIEFSRLFGELGWHGFNSGVISSKRRPVGSSGEPPKPKKEDKDGATKGGEATDKTSAKKEEVVLPDLQFRGFDTRAIHAGAAPDSVTGSRATPIHQTTAYVFEDAEHAASLFNLQTFGNIYSRLSNPTVSVLEERIANLEGGRGTTCTASGHSAQFLAIFTLMQPGDKLVASKRLYGGSITQLGKTINKFDWSTIFVDVDDLDSVKKACSDPKVKLLWAESLANPGGIVSDIAALAEITKAAGIPLIIDNTMATPWLCRPFEHGADIVVHSTTKFLSGHGNSMGGAIVDSGKFDWMRYPEKFPSLTKPEPAYHGLTFAETFGDLAFTLYGHAVGLRDLGPTMAPFNAFLTITGIETLALRMERHCQNGLAVATFLEGHPKVAWVSHAGLDSNRYKPLAQKYLRGHGGSVFTFGLKGGYEAGVKVVERCYLLSHLANLGDVRSLILHPASTTHRQLTPEQRVAAGAGDDVIRLSIGIETVDDIINDLDRALNSLE